MNRDPSRAHFQLGVTYVAMGRIDDAIREFEAALGSQRSAIRGFEAYLGYAYAAAGRPLDARRILNSLESRRREQYVSSFGIALIHDALGEKERALAALERAYEDRAVEFAQMSAVSGVQDDRARATIQETMRRDRTASLTSCLGFAGMQPVRNATGPSSGQKRAGGPGPPPARKSRVPITAAYAAIPRRPRVRQPPLVVKSRRTSATHGWRNQTMPSIRMR